MEIARHLVHHSCQLHGIHGTVQRLGLESGLGGVDNLANAGNLSDNALASERLSGEREDETHHRGAAVELLGEGGKSLRDLVALLVSGHTKGGTAARSDGHLSRRGGEGRHSQGSGGGVGEDGCTRDESHCVESLVSV